MKTQHASVAVVAILVVAAYLAGTLVASGEPSHIGARSPSATLSQWSAISETMTLLLSDDSEVGIYLPLTLKLH